MTINVANVYLHVHIFRRVVSVYLDQRMHYIHPYTRIVILSTTNSIILTSTRQGNTCRNDYYYLLMYKVM